MRNQILPFALLLVFLGSCGDKKNLTKPDPPGGKGLLKVASFDFRLEDNTPGAPVFPLLNKPGELRVGRAVLFTNRDLTDAYVKDDIFGNRALWIIFSPQAALRLEKVTGDNIGKKLAFIIDGVVWIAPVIREKISGGVAQVSGDTVYRNLDRLLDRLRAQPGP